MLDLGLYVQDLITGFEGVITGRCEYITGCNQYLLAPKIKVGESMAGGQWFDEQRIKIVDGKEKIVLDPIKNQETPGCDISAPIK